MTAEPLLIEAVERLLDKVCTFETVEAAEPDGWCAPVWDALVAAGFTRISLPEASGGSGGSLADAMAVLRAVGAHAAPVPLAETSVLGGWLLAQAGLDLPADPITVVPPGDALQVADGRLRGTSKVAWARRATALVGLTRTAETWLVFIADATDVNIEAGTSIAGEPRDAVRFDVALDRLRTAPAPADVDGDILHARGALSRVVMMAGATEALCRLTLAYADERRQFGQPIARFQAIQHHLVTIAQCSAELSMAADVAVRAAATRSAELEIAAAKILADGVAVDATRAAHQVHGAVGVTREYPLHHLSRRLWAWRHEYGNTRAWKRRLASLILEDDAESLFETITK